MIKFSKPPLKRIHNLSNAVCDEATMLEWLRTACTRQSMPLSIHDLRANNDALLKWAVEQRYVKVVRFLVDNGIPLDVLGEAEAERWHLILS